MHSGSEDPGIPPGKGWVNVTAVGYKTRDRSSEGVVTPQIGSPRKYCVHNGIVGAVSQVNVNVYIAVATRENLAALRDADYDRAEINVPFSNGEIPDPPYPAATSVQNEASHYLAALRRADFDVPAAEAALTPIYGP